MTEKDPFKPLSAKGDHDKPRYSISGGLMTSPKLNRNATDKSLLAAIKKKAKEARMKTYSDLMVDLETYGTAPGCVILEIGLVAFDRNNDRRMEGMSFFPDITEQQMMGFTIDPDTLKFWSNNRDAWDYQLNAARDTVANTTKGITNFWNDHCAAGKTLVWAKGTPFDIAILRTILVDPWPFRDIHDMRTLKLVTKSVITVASENAHRGLDDAIAQAKEVRQICSTIGTAF